MEASLLTHIKLRGDDLATTLHSTFFPVRVHQSSIEFQRRKGSILGSSNSRFKFGISREARGVLKQSVSTEGLRIGKFIYQMQKRKLLLCDFFKVIHDRFKVELA